MTKSDSIDREAYLMMAHGLEQMADLQKHTRTMTMGEKIRRMVRIQGIFCFPSLVKLIWEKQLSTLRSAKKRLKRLYEKAGRKPGAFLQLWREDARKRRIAGKPAYRPKNTPMYEDERYFRDGKIAVYMAMFGDYDYVSEPVIQPDNIDYFIISDKRMPPESKWTWLSPTGRIPKELRGDPVLCNRWCKMHPQLLFPDYDVSIYLDSNIYIVSDLTPLASFLDSYPVSMFRHYKRDCVYQEVRSCYIQRRDTKENLSKHEQRLKALGIPEHWGLLEAPVIARRHTDPQCIALMDAWWQNFSSGSRRDQLALIETLWQNELLPEQIGVLGANLYQCDLFIKSDHEKYGSS